MSGRRNRVVITGASGGLGRAFAAALAPHSSAMVLVGRDRARLEALCDQMALEHDVRTSIVAGDATDPEVRRQIVDAASRLGGPLDVLVNAAGINEFHAFESQQPAAVERLLAVNLLAPIQLTQALLPLMYDAARPQVINVGSILGYLGYPGYAVYCAGKFGLRGFSQALRRELADTRVEVRYFAPRSTRTSMNTPAVTAMNRELGMDEDAPEHVAKMLVRFMAGSGWEYKLGLPQRIFVWLNHLVPAMNDKAIRRQLEVIHRHLPGARIANIDRTIP